MDEKYIYQLTGEDTEMIEEHMKFYDDLSVYCEKILDHYCETCDDYELSIISSVYRIYELLDTLKIMTKNSLINSSFIILRALFDICAQTCYMVYDENEVVKRATVFQMLDIKSSYNDDNMHLYEQAMLNKECYKDFVDIVTNPEHQYQYWYSYCEGRRTTFKQLCDTMDEWKLLYNSLYRPLCAEIHESNHMETNIVIEDMFKFKPFRSFENHQLVMHSLLSIMLPTFHILFQYHNEITSDWDDYEIRVKDYLGSMQNIQETFRNFISPNEKWFDVDNDFWNQDQE